MDEQPSGGGDTPKGEENALPLSEAVSANTPKVPVEPAIPAAFSQDVSPGLSADASHQYKPSADDPIFVRVVKDDDLSSFERKSARYAKVGAAIAVISLAATIGAGVVFFMQFQEMTSQTSLLSQSALQARRDSNENSKVTAKQLAALQAQIIVAQKGTLALQGQLKEAQRTTDIAATNLELNNRAWLKITDIKPRGDGEIVPALSYQDLHVTGMVDPPQQQAFLNFEFNAKNVGNSAAINIQVFPELYLAKWHDGYSKDVSDEEARFCEVIERNKEKGEKVGSRPVVATGGPIFPGDTYTSYMGMAGYITRKTTNVFSDMNGSYILPVLIGCVDYQFQSSALHHHVRFVYEAFHAQPNGSRFFLIGEGVKAKDMQLIRNEADDYAN